MNAVSREICVHQYFLSEGNAKSEIYFKETKSLVEFRIPYRNVSIPLAPVVEEVLPPEHLHEVEAVLDTGAVVQGHQPPPSHVRIRAWSGEAVAMIGTLQILWSPN